MSFSYGEAHLNDFLAQLDEIKENARIVFSLAIGQMILENSVMILNVWPKQFVVNRILVMK